MAVTGDVNLSATKSEVIAEIAQRALIAQSTFLGSVRDVSNRARKGAESISFPKYSNLFTVENRVTATAATLQDLTFDKDTLLLDQRATIAWLIDSMDELESELDVQREYIDSAAREHAIDVDRKIITAMEADALTTLTAGAITQDIVLEMRGALLKNKAQMAGLSLQVSPIDEAALLKIDPFVSADKYGRAIIPTGALGTIYGVNVFVNPELIAGQYFMYANGAVGVGFQRAPQFDEVKSPLYGAGSMTQVLDQKYGVKSLQVDVPNAFDADQAAALPAGKSAWMIKDANV